MPRADTAAPPRVAMTAAASRAGSVLPPSVGTRARALADLARWENALIAAAGVALGAWWADGRLGRDTALAALAAVGLTALANAFNDYHDREIDVVAHPARALPSARARPADALTLAATGGVVAAATSLAVSPRMLAATAGVAATMIVYSVRLKRHGLAGNATVALLASLPFVYGAWSVGAAARGLLLYALAVPLHLAREIAKDLDDATGDATSARRTLPLARGARAAGLAVVVSVVTFAVVAVAAFAIDGGARAVLLLAPCLACVTVAGRRAAAGQSGVPRVLKAAMLLAMAAAGVARVSGLV